LADVTLSLQILYLTLTDRHKTAAQTETIIIMKLNKSLKVQAGSKIKVTQCFVKVISIVLL
jgi:hypothetical protein